MAAIVTVTSEAGESRIYPLGAQEVIEEMNVPLGAYHVHIAARRGFQLTCAEEQATEVTGGEPGRIQVTAKQVTVTGPTPRSRASMIPAIGFRRSLSRAIGWRSKPLMLRLRLADGGSRHLEFEAPAGSRVTRAKLVSDTRGEVDIVLRNAARPHLYVPAHLPEVAAGYLMVNLRLRPETIVRAATLTAALTTVAILAIALRWCLEGNPGPQGIAFLFAAPGILAAYFSRTPSDDVVGELFYGVRVMTLLPGLLSFAAAAIVLIGNGSGDDPTWTWATLWVLGGAALLIFAALTVVLQQSKHPREQKTTESDQSPRFGERYRGIDGRTRK